MKKIGSILLMLAAMHFVAVVGFAGYLLATGKLNRASADQIRLALFPQPATTQPTTQPGSDSGPTPDADSPMLRLEQALASNRPATEQVEIVRTHFDQQRAQIERDRRALDAREQALNAREAETLRQEQDKGFQAELAFYSGMPAGQVKKVLQAMDDDQAARYLQALPPRTSTKILKEFKSPEEITRMNAILERVRKSGGSDAALANSPSGGSDPRDAETSAQRTPPTQPATASPS